MRGVECPRHECALRTTYHKGMTCPKCGATTAGDAQFCTNCHATLFFKCPKCSHTQLHGNTCDACGLDLDAFWKQRLAIKRVEEDNRERNDLEREVNNVRTALTVPFSGPSGWAFFLISVLLNRIGNWWRSR